MKYSEPEFSEAALFGLFCSLLASLERRQILNRGEFASDLTETMEFASAHNLFPSHTISEMRGALEWINAHLAKPD